MPAAPRIGPLYLLPSAELQAFSEPQIFRTWPPRSKAQPLTTVAKWPTVTSHSSLTVELSHWMMSVLSNLQLVEAINHSRVGKIKKLLFASSRPIAEVASVCRFSSPAALARFFRKQTGLTPGGWRKRA